MNGFDFAFVYVKKDFPQFVVRDFHTIQLELAFALQRARATANEGQIYYSVFASVIITLQTGLS